MRWSLSPMLLMPLACAAQWNMPGRLVLDGPDPQDRRVTGSGSPTDAGDGVSAATARDQFAVFATATGTDQLSITLQPAPTAYVSGMIVSLEPTAANTGPVTLDVNGLGPLPVVKHATLPLDSGDLRTGIPALLVFDGTAFQWSGPADPACPAGYMAISRDVCMQSTTNDPITFFGANVQCVARGARLCTMGEWYQGCSMPGGFAAGLAAYEWVDHAANNSSDAKRMGMNDLGQIGCKNGGLAAPLTTHVYRCCWDR